MSTAILNLNYWCPLNNNNLKRASFLAIAWLMKKKEGEARDALHHHTIGDISIVWGDDKTGFAKIIIGVR